METKRIKLYSLVLLGLCIVSGLLTSVYDINLNENDLPIPVMVTFTIPALCTVLSLLSTNNFKNFRLDAMGIVGSGILVLAFGILTFTLYFFIGDALRYVQYTNPDTAIVLAICSFVGALPAIALHDTLRKNRLYIKEHGPQPGKFWRNLQYATLLTSTLLVLLPFLPALKVEHLMIMFVEFGTYGSGFWGVQILFVLLSLLLTLIMLLAGWLWKQAKVASVLSVVLLVPFIGFGTYSYLHSTFGMFRGTQVAHYLGYETPRLFEEAEAESDVDVIYVYDETEGDTQEDYDGEYDDEADYDPLPYAPEFIGDGIIGTSESPDQEWGDLDSISASVHYFAKEMDLTRGTIPYSLPDGLLPYLKRSSGNAYRGEYGSLAYDGIITLLWKNRKSMVMEAMVGLYEGIIKEAMPYEKYRDNGYKQLVEQMIQAYDDLAKKPSSFSEIYKLMDKRIYDEASSVESSYVEYYELLKSYVSDKSFKLIFPEYTADPDEDAADINSAKCRAVWIYSFWGRRGQEKIQETVYEGLCRLDKLYK